MIRPTGTSLDPTARLRADYLTLASGQISILLQPTANLAGQIIDPHLILTGTALADIQRVTSLTLNSSLGVDFYGTGSFGETLRNLSILGGGIRGYDQAGGTVTLKAAKLLLTIL